MNFFSVANGIGTFLLGAIFISASSWSLRYALGKLNPFREVVLASGVVQLAVGALFTCSAIPVGRGSSMALVAPQLLFVLLWTAVFASSGAIVLFVKRHDDIERWNADVAALRDLAERQQKELLARLDAAERRQAAAEVKS